MTFCEKHKKLVVSLGILFTLVSAVSLSGLHFNTDFASYTQQSHAPILEDEKKSETSALTLLFRPQMDFMTEKQSCQIKSWIDQLALHDPFVLAIDSPFELRRTNFDGHRLFYERLVGSDCYQRSWSTFPITFDDIQDTPWDGVITGSGRKDLAVTLHVLHDSSSSSGLIKKAHDFATSIDLNVHVTNDHAFQFYIGEGLTQDLRLNLVLLFIFFCIYFLLYRSLAGAAIFIGTIGVANLWLAALIVGIGEKLDLLTSGVFLMTSVAAVQDFIFVVREQKTSPQNSLRDSFHNVALPCFLTTLTTVIGFSALILSDSLIIAKFGFFAAMGSLLEWAVMFIFLPNVLEGNKLTLYSPRKNFISQWIAHKGLAVLPKPIVAGCALIFFAFPMSLYTAKSDASLVNAFPEQHDLHKTQNYMQESRDWLTSGKIVYRKDEANVVEVFKQLERSGYVYAVDSKNKFEQHFTKGLAPAAKKLVLSDLIGNYYHDKYIYDETHEQAQIFLTTTHPSDITHLKSLVHDVCKSCQLSGSIFSFSQFSKTIIPTMFESFFTSLLLILVFLFGLSLFFKQKGILFIVLASLWGVFATAFVFLVVIPTPINYLSCIAFSVLVGLTGDNAIHYLIASKNSLEGGIKRRYQASIEVALFMVVGSFVLLGSYFTYPRSLGIMMAIGFAFSLFGDLFLLRSWRQWTLRKSLKVDKKKKQSLAT